MTGLSAGSLDKRVTLQKIETGQGELGEPLPGVPVDVATVWASAEMMSNRKIRTLDQQQVVETWHFTIRPPEWGEDRLEGEVAGRNLHRCIR